MLSVAKEHLLKAEDFYVRSDYSNNWSVWLSETVIITVLKSFAGKRLAKTKYFHVSYDCNGNWSVWFSETVLVGYGGDPWEVGGSDIQSEAPSRDTLIRDSIQNTSARVKQLKKNISDSLVRHMQNNLQKRKNPVRSIFSKLTSRTMI
jgi:hypothetical protein